MSDKSNKKLLAISIPIISIVAVLLIVLNILANIFDEFIDKYNPWGGNPYDTIQAEGTENWDTDYYEQKYSTKEEATKAGENFVTELGNEGIVLLKNKENALPLSGESTIALMGRYSADPVYGGSGSGTVDAATAVNFKKGFENAGLKVNDTYYKETSSLYAKYDKANIIMDDPAKSTYYIGEIPLSAYSNTAKDSVKGQIAVIVLGRGGGEGGDLATDLKSKLNGSTGMKANSETANYEDGQHQLELNKEEKELINFAKENCSKTIVVLNSSTTMEVGLLESGEYEVDAILECGSIGATAANSLGNIIAGKVNPSGKTVDTWAADFTKMPSFMNTVDGQYTNISDYYGGTAYFIEYEEGIYVGYRYYETAYAEAMAGNYTGFEYDKEVVYPFGYGLSYTTFDKTLESVTMHGDKVEAKVAVKNTGSIPGKDVVEIYYSAPYTKGGTEKSAVVLGGFAKTKQLDAGESESVTVEYAIRDMASYDSSVGGYVLDGGEYVVSLRNDSHNVIDEKTLSLSKQIYTADSATGNAISNQFDDTTAYMNKEAVNMSRADFAGTFPTVSGNKQADETVAAALKEYKVSDHINPSDKMPTQGSTATNYSLIDMRGKDYDDELWEAVLDQISVNDMIGVMGNGAYNTGKIDSINKPATSEPDGPQGFTSLFGSTGNCSYCSEVLMAQSWNTGLMEELGEMIGDEALASGYNGWYAPAMNAHRSPFAGRNFEYYSEDGLLAGKMGAAVVQGAAKKGVYSFVKHFALNDMESHRVEHLCVWANEQAIREIYLKPFEITVKEPVVTLKYIADENGTIATKTIKACTALMSSFNYIGTEWAGGRKSLMTNVLRDEWGFEGVVISDFNLYSYMQGEQGVAAGTDYYITYSYTNKLTDKSATSVMNMRRSMHRMLYTIVNSNAMQKVAPGTIFIYYPAVWQIILYVATAVLGIADIVFLIFVIIKVRKNRTN